MIQVKSVDPLGLTVTTRHYSPELVAGEIVSRLRNKHTDIRIEPMQPRALEMAVAMLTNKQPLTLDDHLWAQQKAAELTEMSRDMVI